VKTEILDAVEGKSLKAKVPHFEIGDIVDVRCRIKEGEKVRTQIFTGTVIGRRGRGINETFTVRRMVGNEGVERVFPLHSPNVLDVVAKRKRQDQTGKALLPPRANRQVGQARPASQRPHRLKVTCRIMSRL